MAANPRVTPQPGELPQIGQKAKPTIPFAPHRFERRALSEQSRITISDNCWRCGGTGFVDRPYAECEDPHCHRAWTEEQVAAHLGPSWRAKRLPCGHPIPHGLVYLNATCQTCGGGRLLEQTITVGQLLDFIESVYASLSQETTARQRIP